MQIGLSQIPQNKLIKNGAVEWFSYIQAICSFKRDT